MWGRFGVHQGLISNNSPKVTWNLFFSATFLTVPVSEGFAT